MLEFKGKYGEAKVFCDSIEEECTQQIYDILNGLQVKGETVRIMSDCHKGSGCVIGYSQTYSQEGALDPDTIGCDISCSVSAIKYSLKKTPTKEDLLLLDQRIRKVIPMGMNICERWDKRDEKEFKKFFRTRLERYCSLWPEMVSFPDLKDTDYFISKFCKRIGLQEGIFWKSLGTLGGGESNR